VSGPPEDNRQVSCHVDTPWGPWLLVASSSGIVRVSLTTAGQQYAPGPGSDEAGDILATAREQILAYLRGERHRFDVPLDLGEATQFQRRVWEACEAVPYGATMTYTDLAETIGTPRAARAVGQALGKNPVPVLIPCHRIVASDGSLGGYGGGLALKRALLALERTMTAT